MDYFNYREQNLYAEQVKVLDIAAKVKTPFYLYSSSTLVRHYKVFDKGLPFADKLICFAVKANSNIAVLKAIANLGAGADVVSQGEIFRAMKAGISPEKIVFSGVGKTEEEITYALKANILQFHCESLEEIKMIDMIARNLAMQANIAIRINPDVAADTHDKISTGKKGDKFGIDIDQVISVIKKTLDYQNINLKGISVHIGSQITSLEPFKRAFAKVVEFVKKLEAENIVILENIDFGGGLAAYYGDHDEVSPAEYGNMLSNVACEIKDKKFIFEPGRLIAANSGILVSSVILVKNTANKKFAILDVAMNDLLRPALYDAAHQIIPVEKNTDINRTYQKYDFVGPICETADVFARDVEFSKLEARDLVAIRSTGAYGAVMSSEYNSRPLIPEVMVKDNNYEIIRSRPKIEELITNEFIPDWL